MIVVDFSFPRIVMEEMAYQARSIIVLDHHESAEKELKDLPFCEFDMERSGGRMMYDWLIENKFLTAGAEDWVTTEAGGEKDLAIPWVVANTEDRDLWRKELVITDEVNASLRSYPFDFKEWDDISKKQPSVYYSEGSAIMRANQILIDQHLSKAVIMRIGEHEVPVVNATVLFSDIAGELSVGQPFGACYFDTAENRVFSLRSQPNGVNVADVAKKYGGGGHRGAAEFRVPLPKAELKEPASGMNLAQMSVFRVT